MKIEAGKFYEMRCGGIRGPMKPNNGDMFTWTDGEDVWKADGYYHRSGESAMDLISEWQPDQPEHPADEQKIPYDDTVVDAVSAWEEPENKILIAADLLYQAARMIQEYHAENK